MTKLAILTAVVIMIGLVPGVALAYPGSINLIPSTDIVGANSLRLSYESEGGNQPYGTGYTQYLYTQFGIGSKLELGYDVYDIKNVTDSRVGYWNAKYLVAPETDGTPAIAVGSMFIGAESKSSYYAVGSKTFGDYCLHLGAETQGDHNWTLAGFNCPLAKSFTFLADYQSGGLGCGTLGVNWQQSSTLNFTVYWTRFNNDALRDTSDFVGFNAAYTLPVNY